MWLPPSLYHLLCQTQKYWYHSHMFLIQPLNRLDLAFVRARGRQCKPFFKMVQQTQARIFPHYCFKILQCICDKSILMYNNEKSKRMFWIFKIDYLNEGRNYFGKRHRWNKLFGQKEGVHIGYRNFKIPQRLMSLIVYMIDLFSTRET